VAGHPEQYGATITLPPGFTSGSYQVRVKLDYTLTDADYTIMTQCYSDIAPPSGPCSAGQKRASDVDDDGGVDVFDLNLWIRVRSSL